MKNKFLTKSNEQFEINWLEQWCRLRRHVYTLKHIYIRGLPRPERLKVLNYISRMETYIARLERNTLITFVIDESLVKPQLSTYCKPVRYEGPIRLKSR